MPRVASTRRMWSEITSHSDKNASLLGATVWPSLRARSREALRAHTHTFIPNAFPYPATTLPIRP
jgi:hypothetical protein